MDGLCKSFDSALCSFCLLWSSKGDTQELLMVKCLLEVSVCPSQQPPQITMPLRVALIAPALAPERSCPTSHLSNRYSGFRYWGISMLQFTFVTCVWLFTNEGFALWKQLPKLKAILFESLLSRSYNRQLLSLP